MRDLDTLNAAAKSTRSVFAISLIIPFLMGGGALALADGAAPTVPVRENYLAVFAIAVVAYSIIALPISYLFRWGWEAKYFGAGMFSLASASLMGVYPILCIAQYSLLPLVVRIIFVIGNAAIIFFWCRRFVKIYRKVYDEKRLFNYIYRERPEAVYYLQAADKEVIGKVLRFEQLPGSKYFVLCLLVAFSLVPVASSVTRMVGLPFVHVFLAVVAMPLNPMFLGICTKIWLVFFFYPMRITRNTHKPIYVDMSTHPKHGLNVGS